MLLGTVVFARQWSELEPDSWTRLVPLVCTVAILLVSLPSRINIGSRHVLPIYPLLAIVAAAGASWLLNVLPRQKVAAGAAAGLLLWHFVSSGRAHPDYLPYFNELAGREPDRILVESDLDWGQDLQRLSNRLAQLGVQRVALRYFGTADLGRHHLPPNDPIDPASPVSGWIAISSTRLRIGGLKYLHSTGQNVVGYAWLDAYRPVEMVGKSIRLYYVPPLANRPN